MPRPLGQEMYPLSWRGACGKPAARSGRKPHVRHETARVHHAARRRGRVAARGAGAATVDAGAYRPSFKEAIRREPYFGTVVTGPMGARRISLKRTSGISASTFRSITDCAAHVMRSACLI